MDRSDVNDARILLSSTFVEQSAILNPDWLRWISSHEEDALSAHSESPTALMAPLPQIIIPLKMFWNLYDCFGASKG